MIRVFVQSLDTSATASTQQATLRQWENELNAFVRDPQVSVQQVQTTSSLNGTVMYVATSVVYDFVKV